MKGQKALFSHKTDEWETPEWLYDLLDKEFGFKLDAAATSVNAKAKLFFDRERDALTQNWDSPAFCNPPYSEIGKFMQKAFAEFQKGSTVVCLIPARTDTRYFHDYCMKASEIRLIKGRVKFINRMLPSYRDDGNFKLSGATFPSLIVVFNGKRSGDFPKLSAVIKGEKLRGKTDDERDLQFQRDCELQNKFQGG